MNRDHDVQKIVHALRFLSSGFLTSILLVLLCLAHGSLANQTPTQSDPVVTLDDVSPRTSVVMRFPDERLANFTCSSGAASVRVYLVVGTKGDLIANPAYEYAGELKDQLTIDGKTRERTFSKRDQFAAELIYFSDCVLKNRKPEPSGEEGLIDVSIIQALYRLGGDRKAGQTRQF